jgi:hypothetical protein
MTSPSFSSPFDFSAPFGVNPSNNSFYPTSTQSTPVSQTQKGEFSPPNYEQVCNGTVKTYAVTAASRCPPPGLVHPSQQATNTHIINLTLLSGLRKELEEAKSQIETLSRLTEKIKIIEQYLIILEKNNNMQK